MIEEGRVMIRIRTVSKVMHAVLLMTVLTPAPLLAESALTAHQMLAQAQKEREGHILKGEVDKIDRSLSLSMSGTAQGPDSDVQRRPAVQTAALPTLSASVEPSRSAPTDLDQVDAPASKSAALSVAPVAADGSTFKTASVNSTDSTTSEPQAAASSIITPLSPTSRVPAAAAAPVAAETAETTVTEAPAAVPAAAPTIPVAETKPASKVIATDTSKADSAGRPAAVAKVDGTKASGAKTSTATRTANAQRSHQHGTRARREGIDFAGIRIRGVDGRVLQAIMSRPEVRSILAQYSLD